MKREHKHLTLDEIVNTSGSAYPGYRVVQPITCADGFHLSVQASNGHHCQGSNGARYGGEDGPVLPYTTVEVGYPSEQPEPWRCSAWLDGYDDHDKHSVCDGWEAYGDGGESSIFAYVPVWMVRNLIAEHGGEVAS